MTPGALRFIQGTELDRCSVAPDPAEFGFDPIMNGVTKLTVVRHYGGDLVEVSFCSVPSMSTRGRRSRDKAAPNAETRRVNYLRSVRRSKAQVRRKCMSGGLDHMLTLTYRANVIDIGEAYSDLARFIRLVRKHRLGWAYCAVHEFQKRGAVHFHLAVRGFQDVRLLRRLWVQVVAEGNIDVQAPRGRGTQKWGLALLAGYLSKYIMKNATESNGRQRYRVSEGIAIPRDAFIYTLERGRSLVQEIMDSFGVNIAYQWEDEEFHHGWACSWET